MDLQKGPLEGSIGRFQKTYRKRCGASRRRAGTSFVVAHLGDLDPTSVGCCSLDRLADGLDRRALPEVGLPGAGRPPVEQVAKVVDEAGPVTDSLPDRPPIARVGVRVVLRTNAPHAIEPGFVGAVAVQQLVQPRVFEDQGPRLAVDLDGEVARPADRGSGYLG